jgi:hypothetical protein
MSELRAPRRVSSDPGARRRSVQGRLSIPFGDDGDGFRRPSRAAGPPKREEAPRRAAPVFHPLAYRGVVAGWTVEDRECWGRRANDLEETGLSWRDAETQAFVEVWHHISRRPETPSGPTTGPADAP